MNHNYCVILAGGAGRKFWPFSRADRPKQFLKVSGTDKSFLRTSFDRCRGIVPLENILVITTAAYSELVKEDIPDMPSENLLVEPYIRDTAPCIAFATYSLLLRDSEANVLYLPCDYKVDDEKALAEALVRCLEASAYGNKLITLGIEPTYPDTNFGYIQVAGSREDKLDGHALKVKTFTEKPNAEIARVFIQSGEFYWNSGLFAAKASVMREEMEKCLPLMSSQFEGWQEKLHEKDFIEQVYGGIEKTAMWKMMEKTERAWIIPGRFAWTDIGVLGTYYDTLDKDACGNAVRVENHVTEKVKETLIVSDVPGKMIAVEGLDNYIVIDTEDVLLICPRERKESKDFISKISMPEFDKYR